MITKKEIAKLEGLAYLYAVSKAKSKKEVAEKLGTSVDTVTKYIAELEAELKTRFLMSNGRGTVITPEGRRILGVADDIIKAIRSLGDYEENAMAYRGIVRLGLTDSISEYLQVENLSGFLQKYPDIHVEAYIGNNLPDMNSLEIDICVAYEVPDGDNLVVVASHELKCGLFASPEYLKNYGHPKNMEDLTKNHRLCYKTYGKVYLNGWKDILEKAEHVVYQTNSVHSLRGAMEAGICIGICPFSYRSKNLIHLSNLNFEFNLPIYLIAHKDTKDMPRIRVMIDYIRDLMKMRSFEQDIL